MDPLSISAAVLIIVGAVTASLKAVKTFQHAPQAFDELAEELEQIKVVANHINTLTEYREFPDVDISVCLSRTRTNMGDAQAVFEERLAQRARKGVFSLRRNILLHRGAIAANLDICAEYFSNGISCDDDTQNVTRRVLKNRKTVNDRESA
ncbi:MAG: hypothetical protein M1835_000075 [Candelina submexicana]|nr:MAG: hypothetical protein M1835_000075 [Candelina submexicana]